MADKYIKVCYRCGSEVYPSWAGILSGHAFTKFKIKQVARLRDFNYFKGDYELCPECYKSFERWLLNEEVNNEAD